MVKIPNCILIVKFSIKITSYPPVNHPTKIQHRLGPKPKGGHAKWEPRLRSFLPCANAFIKKNKHDPKETWIFTQREMIRFSMAISGSDWLEVPTIYKNIPTKYGLIWYSTSILGFWNSHWRLCFMVIIGYGFILFDVYDKLTMITINGCPTITIKHIIQWFILFDNYLMITIIFVSVLSIYFKPLSWCSGYHGSWW